mmetsp:Transcript_102030/g.263770  ORF Transcript_102030/g.263770 Transcript_102030/m.263770 type:complete len:279 (-) Transcript_102030:491-1327(-)
MNCTAAVAAVAALLAAEGVEDLPGRLCPQACTTGLYEFDTQEGAHKLTRPCGRVSSRARGVTASTATSIRETALVRRTLRVGFQPEAIPSCGVLELRIASVLLPDEPPVDVVVARVLLHEFVDLQLGWDHSTLRVRVVAPWILVEDVEGLVVVVAVDAISLVPEWQAVLPILVHAPVCREIRIVRAVADPGVHYHEGRCCVIRVATVIARGLQTARLQGPKPRLVGQLVRPLRPTCGPHARPVLVDPGAARVHEGRFSMLAPTRIHVPRVLALARGVL